MNKATYKVEKIRNVYGKNVILNKYLLIYNSVAGTNIKYSELLSKSRSRYLSDARAVIQASILLKKEYTYKKIANMFRYKTHASVMYNVKKVSDITELTDTLRKIIDLN